MLHYKTYRVLYIFIPLYVSYPFQLIIITFVNYLSIILSEKGENHNLKLDKTHNVNFKTVQPYKAPYLPSSLITSVTV